jgi:hypothetical protein
MELEKTLYRVHDRMLFYEHSRTISMLGMMIFFPLGTNLS